MICVLYKSRGYILQLYYLIINTEMSSKLNNELF